MKKMSLDYIFDIVYENIIKHLDIVAIKNILGTNKELYSLCHTRGYIKNITLKYIHNYEYFLNKLIRHSNSIEHLIIENVDDPIWIPQYFPKLTIRYGRMKEFDPYICANEVKELNIYCLSVKTKFNWDKLPNLEKITIKGQLVDFTCIKSKCKNLKEIIIEVCCFNVIWAADLIPDWIGTIEKRGRIFRFVN